MHYHRREIEIFLSNFTFIKKDHQGLGKLILNPTYILIFVYLRFDNISHLSIEELHSIVSPWYFATWGVDILRLFLLYKRTCEVYPSWYWSLHKVDWGQTRKNHLSKCLKVHLEKHYMPVWDSQHFDFRQWKIVNWQRGWGVPWKPRN